ncbi:MAG: ABC transporter permease [Clostridia bacterium]|nr:ABC transporter permease [Clostridia bacterium]MBQ4624940.1 ABC transporter permease [Clostridia bacterium]
MKILLALVKRNIKLFFRDKGMFFTSLITPVILLVLYASFLGNVFRDSFVQNLPQGFPLEEAILDGLVGGQLISSILAVSCVTVSFCANFLMVQDKANGSLQDLLMAPVKPATLALAYYLATLCSSLLICLAATGLCLAYVATMGFYMTLMDVLLLLLDVLLLVLFGTALSSVINFFLSTQGQISAVGTMISSGYGFICGAYMPIASFGEGLQKVISLLPGTYGTALVRTHSLRGAIGELGKEGIPESTLDEMRSALDCNIDFFGTTVPDGVMYLILVGTILLLVGVYVLLHILRKPQK